MLKRLLITGAAGALGQVAREGLGGLAEEVRLSDIAPMAPAGANEEVVTCDLADAEDVRKLVAGCDGILHLGGISRENSFSKILQGNIIGIYNLYEAARLEGRPRIFYASSNHTIGFHKQDEHLDDSAKLQPDGLYGVSKCFAEQMASLYHNKFGIETALVRIGSCFPEPIDHRMLSTWLSYRDFLSLIRCVFRAPRLGCPVIWGVSNNDCRWWDNTPAAFLGWHPEDNAETFRAQIEASKPRPAKDAVEAVYQGGLFAADPIMQD